MAEVARDLAVQIEHQQWVVISGLAQAIALADLGDAAGAVSILEPLHESALRMGAVQWARRTQAWIARCKVHLGLVVEAEQDLRPLLPEGRPPRSIAERRALFTLAELELRRGRPQRALDLIVQIEPRLEMNGTARPAPALLILQADALAQAGQPEAARAALRRARTLATEHGPRGLLWRISAGLGISTGAAVARHASSLSEAERSYRRCSIASETSGCGMWSCRRRTRELSVWVARQAWEPVSSRAVSARL